MSENNSELSSDEESIFDDDDDDVESSDEQRSFWDNGKFYYDEIESSGEEEALSEEDLFLFAAVERNDADAAEAVQQAIRDGANVNAVRIDWTNDGVDRTPLFDACNNIVTNDQIIRILLDAGADAGWRGSYGDSAILLTSAYGDLSTVQLLIHHDNGLLEIEDHEGWTPLLLAIDHQHSDIARFLLESGADPHHVTRYGATALMYASIHDSLESARLMLAAGVDVEARDYDQQTALHYAARRCAIEATRELILQHNANKFAVDKDGRTPFDLACNSWNCSAAFNQLIEIYGSKLTQDHGRLALHELLKVAEYTFAQDEESFHPPMNLLRIILPLGKLTLTLLRTLLHTLDPELIRNRDDTGKLPIHIACQTNAPVEVLALILELDPTTLHIADSTGALPIHLLCATTAATEHASVRYLVEQGGVGTLAARNQQGASPLHVLCGSTNPPLRTVQYLIQSFPGSVAMQTNAGLYPFMMAAAAESSSASLSVIYELVRANSGLVYC